MLHGLLQDPQHLENCEDDSHSQTPKPPEIATSYKPISLLCVPLKPVERLLYYRINPVIKVSLPHEQAGFRSGRCTLIQIALLTDNIETAFEEKDTTPCGYED